MGLSTYYICTWCIKLCVLCVFGSAVAESMGPVDNRLTATSTTAEERTTHEAAGSSENGVHHATPREGGEPETSGPSEHGEEGEEGGDGERGAPVISGEEKVGEREGEREGDTATQLVSVYIIEQRMSLTSMSVGVVMEHDMQGIPIAKIQIEKTLFLCFVIRLRCFSLRRLLMRSHTLTTPTSRVTKTKIKLLPW